MQNINPTKNRNRRAVQYLWIQGVPVILGGCIALTSVALLSQLAIFASATPFVMFCFSIMGLLSLVFGGLFTYRGLTLKHDNEDAYQVGEMLKQSLADDPRYTFIRNVSHRGLGYIDAILVGPPGALVFRTVNHTGTWRNERAEWKILNPKSGNLRPAAENPSRECARDVYALRKYLAKRKLNNVPVYGVVVFTDPQVTLQGQGQVVPITKTNRMFEIISRDYLKEERINISAIERTVDAIIDG